MKGGEEPVQAYSIKLSVKKVLQLKAFLKRCGGLIATSHLDNDISFSAL